VCLSVPGRALLVRGSLSLPSSLTLASACAACSLWSRSSLRAWVAARAVDRGVRTREGLSSSPPRPPPPPFCSSFTFPGLRRPGLGRFGGGPGAFQDQVPLFHVGFMLLE